MKKLKQNGIKFVKMAFKFYGNNIRENPAKFYVGFIGVLFTNIILFIFSFSLLTQITLFITIIFFNLSIIVEASGVGLGIWELFEKIEIKKTDLTLKLKEKKDKISYYEANIPSLKKTVEICLPSNEPITECLLENLRFRIKLKK